MTKEGRRIVQEGWESLRSDLAAFRDPDHLAIPHYMHSGIFNYVYHGQPPGDFLQAVICNDLSEAVARADDENRRLIPAYIHFFHNYTPAACWGSREKMDAWTEDWRAGMARTREFPEE